MNVFTAAGPTRIRSSATTENVMFANDPFFDNGWRQEGLPPTLAYEGFTDQQFAGASGRHNNTYAVEDMLVVRPVGAGRARSSLWGPVPIRRGRTGESIQPERHLFVRTQQRPVRSGGSAHLPGSLLDPRRRTVGIHPDREYVSLYAQDKWKLTDAHAQPRRALGRRVLQVPPRTQVGLGNEDAEPPVDWDNVSPRVGFAYALGGDRKAVLRGGYGLMYNRSFTELFTNFFTQRGL